jgi:hypothetical protein
MEISPVKPVALSLFSGPIGKRESDSESNVSNYTSSSSDASSLYPRGARTEHIMELANGKNRPWAMFRVFSSARSPEQIPLFYEGESITGSVELILQNSDPIHSISITVFTVPLLAYVT